MGVPLKAVVIAMFIHFLWGGNPVAVKFGLLAFPPMWSAFIRFVIGIVCIVTWAKLNKIRLWPYLEEWPALMWLGALFFAQIALMNIGIDLSTGAISAVLISTYPLFAALLAHWIIPGDKLSPLKAFGLIVAFSGVGLILLRGSDIAALPFANRGNWIVLANAVLLGARLVFSARLLRSIDAVRVLVWQMLFALPLFLLGGAGLETIAWENLDWKPVAGLAYQGIVIAGLGFMVSSYLMKHYSPSVMVSFGFVSPVSGVLLSVWLLSETLTWNLVVGVATVALGLVLIARKGEKRRDI